MSILVDRKPERAIQAKTKDMQKKKKRIYSRWVENPKGRFRQKLGKNIQKKAMTM
jgi:hypothetical protein